MAIAFGASGLSSALREGWVGGGGPFECWVFLCGSGVSRCLFFLGELGVFTCWVVVFMLLVYALLIDFRDVLLSWQIGLRYGH